MPITDEIAELRARWNRPSLYQKFEHAVIVVLTTLIAVLIVLAVWNSVVTIFKSILASGFDRKDRYGFWLCQNAAKEVRIEPPGDSGKCAPRRTMA